MFFPSKLIFYKRSNRKTFQWYNRFILAWNTIQLHPRVKVVTTSFIVFLCSLYCTTEPHYHSPLPFWAHVGFIQPMVWDGFLYFQPKCWTVLWNWTEFTIAFHHKNINFNILFGPQIFTLLLQHICRIWVTEHKTKFILD